MYRYVNEGGDFDVVTPQEMPKHEVISHSAKKTHSKFTYSNGLVIETIVEPERIEFISNVELIKEDDGKYHPNL